MLYWCCLLLFISVVAIFGFKYLVNEKAAVNNLPQNFEHYQSLDSLKVIKSGKVSMTRLLESTEDIGLASVQDYAYRNGKPCKP